METFYFNPGDNDFRQHLEYNNIYVDKTELILNLNDLVYSNERYICDTRPRRFGKTMNVNMLTAYYSYSENKTDIFNDKKISKTENWDKYLGKFNVIRLNMFDFFNHGDVNEGTKMIAKTIVDEVKEKIENFVFTDENNIIKIFESIKKKTKKGIVLIIDEWDCILRKRRYENYEIILEQYLDFLCEIMKNKTYLALVYMTGILPIKKYGRHSSLNFFEECTMISPWWLAKFIGFTDKEVMELCKNHEKQNEEQKSNKRQKVNNIELDNRKEYETQKKQIEDEKHNGPEEIENKELFHKNEIYKKLNHWYNGYKLKDKESGHIYEIYTPFSIVQALKKGVIENYWNQTETFKELEKYINMNYDGLKEYITILMSKNKEGKRNRLKIDTKSYQNDMNSFSTKDDVLTMLIHLGYLGYDIEKGEIFIPNNELYEEFVLSTKSNKWKNSFKILEQSQELLEATWNHDEEKNS